MRPAKDILPAVYAVREQVMDLRRVKSVGIGNNPAFSAGSLIWSNPPFHSTLHISR